MKQKIFKLLIQYKIIRNGYLNPLILWGFLALTPPLMYFTYHREVAAQDYMNDDELIAMIIKNYEEDNEDVFTPEENVKTEVKTSKISYAPEKKDIAQNLQKLLQKINTNKNDLSKWDHFRLKVYQCAIAVKQKYPSINGTPEQIYDWSMKTFWQESKYIANISNPHSSANGLFQAMATTRKELNMPLGLSLINQVPYYQKYVFNQIDNQRLDVSKIGSALDWYLIVFFPHLSDKTDATVFARCGGYEKKYCVKPKGWKHCNYHANCGYDLNKDGIIYKSEIGNHLLSHY